MNQKPYDDLVVGERFQSTARTITESDIVTFTNFAGIRMAIFRDEEYCKKHSVFGTRVAPGLMTASSAGGMLEECVLGKYTISALGLDDFKFLAPVRAGDTLHAQVTVASKKDTRTPGRGILGTRVEVFNQNGETPLVFSGAFMMRKGVVA